MKNQQEARKAFFVNRISNPIHQQVNSMPFRYQPSVSQHSIFPISSQLIRFALSSYQESSQRTQAHHFNIKFIISDMQKQVPDNANQECPGSNSTEAGKQKACQGCPNQTLCASGAIQVNPAIAIIADKLKSVKHKILVLSGKGGVGKSTVATQLALLLSQKYEVGLLDVDICGPSVPTMLGLVGQEVHQSNSGWSPVYCGDLAVMSIGFLLSNQNDAVIWRGPRKNGLIQQFLQEVNWGELDYLIIDTPPGTSDEHLSLVQFLQCGPNDGALVVTTPQEVALADVRKQLSFCIKTGIPIIGVVENMSGFVCPNCKCEADLFNASSGGATKMCEQYKCTYFFTKGSLVCKIPLDPKIQARIDKGQSIFQQPTINSPVVDRYHQIQLFLKAKFETAP